MDKNTEGPLESIIQRHIINSENRSRRAATFELRHFPPNDLETILSCLAPESKKANSDPCGPLWNRHVDSSSSIFTRLGAVLLPSVFQYVKAPIELIQQSIETGSALCVNSLGRLELKRSGYAVVSHVWGETMAWQTPTSWGPVELSVRKMGLPLMHLQRFFEHCKTSVDWMWLDVIALPEVLEDMNETEKEETHELRARCINGLHDVYTQADFVVVLDSTLLRLSSESQIDVAVVLSLSGWIGRMWCFTEAWLARAVKLETATRSFDLDEIIDTLDSFSANNQQHRYFDLFVRVSKLRPESAGRIPIVWSDWSESKYSPLFARLVFSLEKCSTKVTEDYVRAVYPILSLNWESEWTTRDGVNHLYASYPGAKDSITHYLNKRNLNFSSDPPLT